MKKRHLKIFLGLSFFLIIVIVGIAVEYLRIQNVKNNPQDYILLHAKMIDKKPAGRYDKELSVVQYKYDGTLRNAEVSYSVSDSKNKNIPIAINKLTGKVIRMDWAFGFYEICMYIVLLGLFLLEYLLYREDKNKIAIRKAKEMAKDLDGCNANIKMHNSSGNCVKEDEKNVRKKYTKRIDAIIIKIKRECEVDYDYIWIWCEGKGLSGEKRKFKSGKVIETKKWKVGDVITVLINPDNERNYKVMTDTYN